MRILVIANCQQSPIESILRFNGLDVQRAIKPLHELTDKDVDIVRRQVESAEVVVLQHNVAQRYVDMGLSPDFLRKMHGNVVIVPNVFFSGYHPTFVSMSAANAAQGGMTGLIEANCLGPHFDLLPVVAFQRGLSVGQVISSLETGNIGVAETWSSDMYEGLRAREAYCDVGISDYIRDNAGQRVLFFTFNHPTNELLLELCRRVIEKIGLEMEVKSRVKPYLSNYRLPVYPAVAGLFGVSGLVSWPVGGGDLDHDMMIALPTYAHVERTMAWLAANASGQGFQNLLARWRGSEAIGFANKILDELERC